MDHPGGGCHDLAMVNDPRLGTYLRARRAAALPAESTVSASLRRVPGLRREEVAARAAVSVDYYTRLEQGRASNPSAGVVTALASALCLDAYQQAHLEDLCRRPAASPPAVAVAPQLQRLLDAMASVPALVFGRSLDVLAHNALAAALICDFASGRSVDRNLARHVFLDPASRTLYTDWEHVAQDIIGVLRSAVGRHPEDASLRALISELQDRSEPFRHAWPEHHVTVKTRGHKRLAHPVVGPLELDFEAFAVQDGSDQVLVTYIAAQGGDPADIALRLLESWSATASGLIAR